MQSPDPARAHLRGTFFAATLLLVTAVSAVGLVGILFVGGLGGGDDGGGDVVAAGTGPTARLAAPTTPETKVAPSTTTSTSAPPTTPAPTAAPTTATTAPPPPPPQPVVAASAGGALCIGDSVMQSASPMYYNLLGMCGVVDATVSRSWGAASGAIRGYAPYPDRVVIHLGTNGFTNAGEIDATLQQLSSVPRVVLVNVQLNGSRRWEASVNDEILAAAARWPNVRIADWRGVSAGHPEFFRADRIHPTREGAQAYANVIAGAL